MNKLETLHEQISVCERCQLSTTRVLPVLDALPTGSIRIMLVGEAPGGHEATISGQPFSGQAGQILETFLHSIGLERGDLYVTNLVKCRPVKPSAKPRYGNYANRKPTAAEIRQCAPYLREEIQNLQPALVVTLGKTPLDWFFANSFSMKEVHGRMLKHQDLDVMVYAMYHPASLIYNKNLAEEYQEDLEKLRRWLHGGASEANYENICNR